MDPLRRFLLFRPRKLGAMCYTEHRLLSVIAPWLASPVQKMSIATNTSLSSARHHRTDLNRPMTITIEQKRSLFWEPSSKGSLRYEKKVYDKLNDMSVKDVLKQGTKVAREEFALWKTEMKDHLSEKLKKYNHGDIDYLFNFRDINEIKRWKVSCDSDWDEGYTTAEFVQSPNGYGLFSGYLETTLPKDGRIKRAGWANLSCPNARKSFYRDDNWNWEELTHVVLRVRGDGRPYMFRLKTKGWADVEWLAGGTFPVYTHGGPYWQFVKIPVARLVQDYKGRIQDRQHRALTFLVSGLGISVMDDVRGPFSLEIDYIGMMMDMVDRREFEYESYNMPEKQWHEP